jgi:hypothetical protein
LTFGIHRDGLGALLRRLLFNGAQSRAPSFARHYFRGALHKPLGQRGGEGVEIFDRGALLSVRSRRSVLDAFLREAGLRSAMQFFLDSHEAAAASLSHFS